MHPFTTSTQANPVPAALQFVPVWATRVFGSSAWHGVDRGSGILGAWGDDGLCAMAATLPGAAALGRCAFEREVTAIYTGMLGALRRRGHHPLRFWNFIPDLNAEIERGLSRYMIFNAARHAGYRTVHAAKGALPSAMATASGVGSPDDGFHVYCVATRDGVTPVENPRQVPAHEYSPRYGPLPPCFARAMLTGAPARLVIGGTASVRGEDSVHADNLSAQLGETLLNLRTLIAAGCDAAGLRLEVDALRALVSVCAYVVEAGTAAFVRDALAPACGLPLGEIELRVADLCRPDLLVEIEGVAALDRVTVPVWPIAAT